MSEFFTVETLLSFGGMVLGTVVVVNALLALPVGPKIKPYVVYIALAVGVALSYLRTALGLDNVAGDVRWILAFFNGLVVFLAAVGANELLPTKTSVRVALPPTVAEHRAARPQPVPDAKASRLATPTWVKR